MGVWGGLQQEELLACSSRCSMSCECTGESFKVIGHMLLSWPFTGCGVCARLQQVRQPWSDVPHIRRAIEKVR